MQVPDARRITGDERRWCRLATRHPRVVKPNRVIPADGVALGSASPAPAYAGWS
jgi:hypothetical protein